MSDLIESIKQGADQVLSNIDQKGQLKSALEGIRHQWNEMERRRKTSALEKEIKTQQAEMKQLTEALGLQTWSLFDTGKIVHPELTRLCERISEVRAEIDAKKAELDALAAQHAAEQEARRQAAQQAAAQQQAARGTATQAPGAQSAAPVRTVIRLRCPRCKTELAASDDFCPKCGVKIVRSASQATRQPPSQVEQPATTSGIQFCPSCGAQTRPNAQFCPICGQTLSQESKS